MSKPKQREKSRPKKPDWDAMERASMARAREYYLNTTPGERLEHALSRGRSAPADPPREQAQRH